MAAWSATNEAGDRGEIGGKSPMPQRTKNVLGIARTIALNIDNRFLESPKRTRNGQTKTRFHLQNCVQKSLLIGTTLRNGEITSGSREVVKHFLPSLLPPG